MTDIFNQTSPINHYFLKAHGTTKLSAQNFGSYNEITPDIAVEQIANTLILA